MASVEYQRDGSARVTRNDGVTATLPTDVPAALAAAIAAFIAQGPADPTPPKKMGLLLARLVANGAITPAQALAISQADD